MFEVLKKRWEQNRITVVMLRKYVQAGRITPDQFKTITGYEY